MEEYGWIPGAYPGEPEGMLARVTAVHRDRYELISQQGVLFGRLKAAAYYGGDALFPTVGDFVWVDAVGEGDCRIRRTAPRKTCFTRLDPSASGHGEQGVAANFDGVLVMQSLNENFNLSRLERYLTLAWQSGAVPVVVLTKADLAADVPEKLAAAAGVAVGAEVFAVSAYTGEGLSAFDRYLTPGKTAVFLGSSGVGKSSLVNALAGEELMVTGAIREEDGRGRHTTTHRQLLRLPNGAMIIDTPGMRELGMWDVTQGMGQSFADVEQYFGQCRFRDCRHQGEPGCAVLAAIEAGLLPRARFESYQKLKAEAKYADDKPAYLLEKQRWHKEVAKFSRQRKKQRQK